MRYIAGTAADTPPWGDANVNFLTNMHLLQTLILARTHVGSVHLEVLAKLNQLRHLDLSHTMLANESLLAAKDALTGLEHFDVSYTCLVSELAGLFSVQAVSMQGLSCYFTAGMCQWQAC